MTTVAIVTVVTATLTACALVTRLAATFASLSADTSTRSTQSINSIKKKRSPYSITERRVPDLFPALVSQPAGDVSHKPGGRLPLLSARPAVTPATLKRAATNFCCLVNRGTMGVNSLLKTVTRQRRDCDLNPGPSAPESSTLTTRLPSHPTQLHNPIPAYTLSSHLNEILQWLPDSEQLQNILE